MAPENEEGKNGINRRAADLAEYVEAIFPLLGLILSVPLEDMTGAPPGLHQLHRALKPFRIISPEDFTKARQEGRWWTLLYGTVKHYDIAHLSSNLQGLLIWGAPLFLHNKDALEVYAVFLFGGALSAHTDQSDPLRRDAFLLDRIVSSFPQDPFPSSWQEANNWYTRQLHGLARHIKPIIASSLTVNSIGASAGVCALMGASLCVATEQLYDVGCDLIALRSTTAKNEKESRLRTTTIKFLSIGAHILFIISCMESEYALSKSKPGDKVNHASHVDGFMYGFLIYSTIWAAKKLRKMTIKRKER